MNRLYKPGKSEWNAEKLGCCQLNALHVPCIDVIAKDESVSAHCKKARDSVNEALVCCAHSADHMTLAGNRTASTMFVEHILFVRGNVRCRQCAGTKV